MSGDGPAGRYFYANQVYAGCAGDLGWIVVSSGDGGRPCNWESSAGTGTRILYSNTTSVTNWNDPTTVGAADTMMVFVR